MNYARSSQLQISQPMDSEDVQIDVTSDEPDVNEEECALSKKMEILDKEAFDQDPTNLTLVLYEEDHTIGNSIKHILTRYDEVEFCGYNVPHPLEDKILLRVQTHEGHNALEVLCKGFEDLELIFATIREKFVKAYDDYSSKA